MNSRTRYVDATKAIIKKQREEGTLKLEEYGGYDGVWVLTDVDRFFYAVSLSHHSHSTIEDSEDPDDHVLVWVDGVDGPVQVEVDVHSGRLRNYESVKEKLKRELVEDKKNDKVVSLRDVSVKEYRRKDGTVVTAHKRWTDKIKRFVGPAKTVQHAPRPKKFGPNDPDPVQSDEWHVYQNHGYVEPGTGKKIPDHYVLVHPQTGELAPTNTVVGNPEDEDGTSKRTGYYQSGGGRAAPLYDVDDQWDKKIREVSAMVKSEHHLASRVQADLSKSGWPKDKRCALATLLINRHVFRVGKEGAASNVTKGNQKEATYVNTKGFCTLTPEEIVVNGNDIVFSFLGKSAKTWKVVETDPKVALMVRELVESTPSGKPVFGIKDDDVRSYLSPYGFSPHRFRTYWASYLFFATVKERVKESGGPIPENLRKKVLTEAGNVAATKLNDTYGAAMKSYVLPSLIDQLLKNGDIKEDHSLHEYKLNENSFGYWLPWEQEFQSHVMSHPEFEDAKIFGEQGGIKPNQDGQSDTDFNLDDEGNKSREPISLSELVFLSAWPELQPGDHWVTMKPHGPDSEDYHRVIIREHPDGSAHVVWSGAKSLQHLKLTRHGMDRSTYDREEAKQRNANRVLTPEEKQQADENREIRRGAIDREKEAFGSELVKALGITDDSVTPQSLAEAFLKGKMRAPSQPKTGEDYEIEKQKIEERARKILDGELPELRPGPTMGDHVDTERALSEASTAEMTGETPHALATDNENVKQAWNQVRSDPEACRHIAGLKALYDDRVSAIKRETGLSGRGNIRVVERMAFYDEPDEAERALLNQAANKAEYQMNSRFWHLNSGGKIRGESGEEDEPGLGNGSKDFFIQGSTDALGTFSGKYSVGKTIDPTIVEALGPEVMAAALAADIIANGEGRRQAALKGIENFMASDKAQMTVASAIAIAEEVDEERRQIRNESGSMMLTDVARMNALKNQTIRKQKAVARAAGSLETAAGMADFLRKGTGDGITIKPGDAIDAVRGKLEKSGLNDGDGYQLVYGTNGEVGIHIPTENLPKLLAVSQKAAVDNEEIKAIKNHQRASEEFHVPGLKEGIRLKPQQIAAIQFFEKMGKIYGNIGVGLGKTITLGSAAARLIASGEAKRGLYVVPTNLIKNTQRELEDKFPGLKIVVAHSDYNPDIKTTQDRKNIYENGDYHILIVGQDSIRNDASELKRMCEGPNRPGFIFGDEIHTMFTPGESTDVAKQAKRANALNDLRTDYMFATTGTPLRRSAGEVWKVLNWLKPGEWGSMRSWMLRYGKIGQGISAFDGAVNEAFRNEINDTAITETDKPTTNFTESVVPIQLSHRQQEAYRNAQTEYEEARKRPGADVRKLVAAKIKKQHEAIYGGSLEDNASLQELHRNVEAHRQNGNDVRGLIHCTSIPAVKSIVRSFRPGEFIAYIGEVSNERRDEFLGALNDGTIVNGIRAAGPDGTEGVVTSVNDTEVTIKGDNGKSKKFAKGDVESRLVGIAGTSFSVGIISTGLNAQRGANWTVHYQLADYGSTHIQRNAREYRTGQTRDVHSDVFVPQTPMAREHWQRNQAQIKLNEAFDDPDDYDENDLFPREQDKERPEVSLAEVPYHLEGGRGSSHKGAKKRIGKRIPRSTFTEHGLQKAHEYDLHRIPRVNFEANSEGNYISNQFLPIDEVHATQEGVDKEKVEGIKKKIDENPNFLQHGAIRAIKFEGKYYLLDGHHRVAAAIQKGRKALSFEVFNYDRKVHAEENERLSKLSRQDFAEEMLRRQALNNDKELDGEDPSESPAWIIPDGTIAFMMTSDTEGTHVAMLEYLLEDEGNPRNDFYKALKDWGWIRTTVDNMYDKRNQSRPLIQFYKTPTDDQLWRIHETYGDRFYWEKHVEGKIEESGDTFASMMSYCKTGKTGSKSSITTFLGEHRSLMETNKGEGSAHKGGKYDKHLRQTKEMQRGTHVGQWTEGMTAPPNKLPKPNLDFGSFLDVPGRKPSFSDVDFDGLPLNEEDAKLGFDDLVHGTLSTDYQAQLDDLKKKYELWQFVENPFDEEPLSLIDDHDIQEIFNNQVMRQHVDYLEVKNVDDCNVNTTCLVRKKEGGPTFFVKFLKDTKTGAAGEIAAYELGKLFGMKVAPVKRLVAHSSYDDLEAIVSPAYKSIKSANNVRYDAEIEDKDVGEFLDPIEAESVLLFDILIHNQDRHGYNLGIIRDGVNHEYWSLWDHERSFSKNWDTYSFGGNWIARYDLSHLEGTSIANAQISQLVVDKFRAIFSSINISDVMKLPGVRDLEEERRSQLFDRLIHFKAVFTTDLEEIGGNPTFGEALI